MIIIIIVIIFNKTNNFPTKVTFSFCYSKWMTVQIGLLNLGHIAQFHHYWTTRIPDREKEREREREIRHVLYVMYIWQRKRTGEQHANSLDKPNVFLFFFPQKFRQFFLFLNSYLLLCCSGSMASYFLQIRAWFRVLDGWFGFCAVKECSWSGGCCILNTDFILVGGDAEKLINLVHFDLPVFWIYAILQFVVNWILDSKISLNFGDLLKKAGNFDLSNPLVLPWVGTLYEIMHI